MDVNLNLPKINPTIDRPIDKARDDARREETRQSDASSNQLNQENLSRDLRASQTKSSVAKSQIQKSEHSQSEAAHQKTSDGAKTSEASQAEKSAQTEISGKSELAKAADPQKSQEAQKNQPQQPSLNQEAYKQIMKGADPRFAKAGNATTQAPAAAMPLPPQNAQKAAATQNSEQASADLARSQTETPQNPEEAAAAKKQEAAHAEAPHAASTETKDPSTGAHGDSTKAQGPAKEQPDVKFFSLGDANTAAAPEEMHESQVLNLRAQVLFNGRPSFTPGQPLPTASTQSFTIAEMRRGDYKKLTGSEGKGEKTASATLGRSVALGFRRQSRDTAV